MDTIAALKRLERAGSENSRVTEKLHEAANEIASQIEPNVPVNVTLPRRYMVREIRSNVGSEKFLIRASDGDEEIWIDGTGNYLHGDFHCEIPAQTREGSLLFAKDIAEGLLDEIAQFIEERTAESDAARRQLETVKQ